jgi:glycosyltransferase involved in cell wall biosynthesis
MMAHRPIAVADGPFFTEFDREVLRFSYADREDMAETVATLVEDKARQQSLVQAADAYIANCTPDKIARRYESLYQRVLKGE